MCDCLDCVYMSGLCVHVWTVCTCLNCVYMSGLCVHVWTVCTCLDCVYMSGLCGTCLDCVGHVNICLCGDMGYYKIRLLFNGLYHGALEKMTINYKLVIG